MERHGVQCQVLGEKALEPCLKILLDDQPCTLDEIGLGRIRTNQMLDAFEPKGRWFFWMRIQN